MGGFAWAAESGQFFGPNGLSKCRLRTCFASCPAMRCDVRGGILRLLAARRPLPARHFDVYDGVDEIRVEMKLNVMLLSGSEPHQTAKSNQVRRGLKMGFF